MQQNQALVDGVIFYLQNDIIPRDINREGNDFMKCTTFSESFSKPSIVPYNQLKMGPSSNMKLSSSYEKHFNH